ncbi:MAG: DUF1987 domain-containing protein [Salinivirgaceae bacterium]|nr:DUF1987 domain-containing protein [Salinivirgaceae bacterium]MDD4747404.1 DUF1987 domain-containing protein [Salinivirgaceae bacterium]MDY0280492.1 DUF1987 domain-containing protein [Salinivirgaceae bacterium]
MLYPLFIEETEDTPRVLFDPTKGIFEISKKSLPEDAIGFYNSIFEWFNLYIDNPNIDTNFCFNLEYYSTSTAKQITKLMFLLEKLSERSNVKVTWKYKAGDKDMEAAGKRYKSLINMDIEIKEE